MWTTPKPCAAVVCGVAVLFFAAPGVLLARHDRPHPRGVRLEDAIGKEDYTQARKLADAILRGGAPEDCLKTMRVYGRILLGLRQEDKRAAISLWCRRRTDRPRPAEKPSGPPPSRPIKGSWPSTLPG